MYTRHVDPSVLVFSLSLNRHPHMCIPFSSRLDWWDTYLPQYFPQNLDPTLNLLWSKSTERESFRNPPTQVYGDKRKVHIPHSDRPTYTFESRPFLFVKFGGHSTEPAFTRLQTHST